MEEGIFKAALEQGLWAVLFVSLYFWQLKTSKSREDRLMDFIDKITEQFENLDKRTDKIASDVADIKQEIREGRKVA
jgi:hypothetical protein